MSETPNASGLGQSGSKRAAPQSLETPRSNLESAAHGRTRLTPKILTSTAVRNVAATMRARATVSTASNQVTLTTTPPAQVLPSILPSQPTAAADQPLAAAAAQPLVVTREAGEQIEEPVVKTSSEGGQTNPSQSATNEVDATQPPTQPMPRNLTQDLHTLSPNLAELSSVLRGIRSSTPSAQPSIQAPNPVEDMAISSASFHTTGTGETTISSHAPNLPPNATQE